MKCVSIFGGFKTSEKHYRIVIDIYKNNGFTVFFYNNPVLHLINIDKCKRIVDKNRAGYKHKLSKTVDNYTNMYIPNSLNTIFLETCDHIGLLNVEEYHRKYYDFYYSKLNNTVICRCKNDTIIDVPFIDSIIKINTHYDITSFGFHSSLHIPANTKL